MYEPRCTNDVKFFDTYETFKDYWKETSQCGKGGSLSPSVIQVFDTMRTEDFLEINGIMGPFVTEAV